MVRDSNEGGIVKIQSVLWNTVCLPVQLCVDLSARDVVDIARDISRHDVLYFLVLLKTVGLVFQIVLSKWVILQPMC